MIRSKYSLASIVLASLAAGPVFLLGLAASAWAATAASPVPIPADLGFGTFGVVVVTIPAIVVGFVLAIVPNILGATVMTRLGRRNVAMRLPIAWALAGGLATGLPFELLSIAPAGDDRIGVFAFVFTGTCCALICRRRAEWAGADDRALPSRRLTAIGMP